MAMLMTLTALAMQIAALQVGVATASPDGQVCVAMAGPVLPPGATFTLIQPDAPQWARAATVVRSAPSCQSLDRALIPGPYYLARWTASPPSEAGSVWVALPGVLGTKTDPTGAIAVQISDSYPNAHIRSCTSHEGLHITVWAGAPLTSQRLWHQYYYLGYDVEPSCDERDVRDAP